MNRTPLTGLLRQAREDDADRIREFVCGLSSRSQYFRFFAAVAPPSTGLLRALCGIRQDGTGQDSGTGKPDILLVTDAAGTVIGHGMGVDQASRAAGRLATDIGLVVADRWQRQGIGTTLLTTLASRAASRGAGTLVLDVLPANAQMLGIIARRWPAAPRERTPDAIVLRPQLTPHDQLAGLAVPALIRLTSRDSRHHREARREPDRSAA